MMMLAETINGLYKAEVIYRRGPWRSFEAVEFATLEWVDWFNNRRLLDPIGNIPPAEAEERRTGRAVAGRHPGLWRFGAGAVGRGDSHRANRQRDDQIAMNQARPSTS
jgi:putative transposase